MPALPPRASLPSQQPPPSHVPIALRIAAGLVGVEAVLVAAVGVSGFIRPSHVGVAAGMGVLYFVVAVGLAIAGVGLWECRSWGRAPVVVAQLVIFGVAWDLHRDVVAVAIPGAILGGMVLACVFHPASLRALSGAP